MLLNEETEAQRSDDMLKLEQLAFEFKMLLPLLRNVLQRGEPHASTPMRECGIWDYHLVTDERFQFRGLRHHLGDSCGKHGPSIV